jgi:hypothetical protein
VSASALFVIAGPQIRTSIARCLSAAGTKAPEKISAP